MMKTIQKEYDIIENVILPNFIWYVITGILSAFGLIVGLIININSQFPIPISIIAFCFFIASLTLISNFIIIIQKRMSKNNTLLIPQLQTNYKILEAEFELFFRDREHIIQRQTIKYEVASDSLCSIHHTMQWTGSSYHGSQLDSQSKSKGYILKEMSSSSYIYNIQVNFPEPQNRGFTDSYVFETNVEDAYHKMEPFLGRLIKCETQKLILRVTAPEGIIKNCVRYVSADIPGNILLSSKVLVQPKKIGDLLIYEHKFENLDWMRYYFLRWEFEGK